MTQTSSSAVRNRVGIWLRKRPSASSTSTPRMLVRAPVMPTSEMNAVPLREHPGIGRRHVGVGAEHRRHPAVEVPAHRHLLARHLGVEVDDHDLGALAPQLGDLGVGGGEGGAGDGQLQLAAQVEHADPDPVDLDDRRAPARVSLRVVGGTDQHLAAVDELVGVALAVDVVAGRDQLDAGGEDVVGRPLRDPRSAGGVLAVGDDQVGAVRGPRPRHRGGEPAPAGPADDVSDEEDPHAISLDE